MFRLLLLSPLAALGLVAAMLLAPAVASAHAYYVSSTPAANAVVKSAPTLVTVHFAEQVNPQGSDIVVYDAKHKQVSTAPAQVLHSDLKTMTVPMAGDGDGTYFVEWHTVSAQDGDPDIGGFNFTVSASGQADTTSAPATTTTQKGGSSGVPIWLTVVIGLVGLAIGGGGGFFAARGAAGGPK